MRKLLTLLIGLSPSSALKNRLLNLLGHQIHRSANIGPIIILGCTKLTVSAGVRIGPFNVFRNLTIASIGQNAEIGQWNWISAAPFLVAGSPVASAGTLVLGPESSVTSRHYFDVSGGVTVGAFSTVAGVRSTFMTHGIHVGDSHLHTAPIEVGAYAMVGSNCSLVYGATVPDRSVVAMGSVVIPGLHSTCRMYAGVPAREKSTIEAAAYWERTDGAVMPHWHESVRRS